MKAVFATFVVAILVVVFWVTTVIPMQEKEAKAAEQARYQAWVVEQQRQAAQTAARERARAKCQAEHHGQRCYFPGEARPAPVRYSAPSRRDDSYEEGYEDGQEDAENGQ